MSYNLQLMVSGNVIFFVPCCRYLFLRGHVLNKYNCMNLFLFVFFSPLMKYWNFSHRGTNEIMNVFYIFLQYWLHPMYYFNYFTALYWPFSLVYSWMTKNLLTTTKPYVERIPTKRCTFLISNPSIQCRMTLSFKWTSAVRGRKLVLRAHKGEDSVMDTACPSHPPPSIYRWSNSEVPLFHRFTAKATKHLQFRTLPLFPSATPWGY